MADDDSDEEDAADVKSEDIGSDDEADEETDDDDDDEDEETASRRLNVRTGQLSAPARELQVLQPSDAQRKANILTSDDLGWRAECRCS